MALLLLAYLHLAPFQEITSSSFKKKICFLANWTSVFSCLFSFLYPPIHSCLLLHSTSLPPIHHLSLFLPFSHPSVTTYTSFTHSLSICCSLSHNPDTHHHSSILYVYLLVSIRPTHTHTLQPPPRHISTVVLLLSTYFVFPHLWVVSNVCVTVMNASFLNFTFSS